MTKAGTVRFRGSECYAEDNSARWLRSFRAMAAISLRPGAEADAATLFAMHRESAMAAYVDIFPQDRYAFPDEAMRAHWVAKLADAEATAIVAERAGRPVGFVCVSPGWLESLFVVPAEWGSAVGRALHDEAVARLGLLGDEARLWVLEANERARRFYERRGWRPDGRRSRSPYPPYPQTLRYRLDLPADAPRRSRP
jgi:GNAT superfamily N-acetyltransferase